MTEGEAKALIKEVNKKNTQILENMTKLYNKNHIKVTLAILVWSQSLVTFRLNEVLSNRVAITDHSNPERENVYEVTSMSTWPLRYIEEVCIKWRSILDAEIYNTKVATPAHLWTYISERISLNV